MTLKVNINPGVSVLSVLPSLNYSAWYALAEFIDNSIQSFEDNKKDLQKVAGKDFSLEVNIKIDPQINQITICDNAAGIKKKDYSRAFRPAALPPVRDGLNEFGMGMKSAACWFARNWTVTTKALGEREERTIKFDVDKIISGSIEELEVVPIPRSEDDHYTEIALENVFKVPKNRTIDKIKSHLTDIYREYLRSDLVKIFVNDEPLKFEEIKVLYQPKYDKESKPVSDTKILWKKEVNFRLAKNQMVQGFLALRETGAGRINGLALFRRKRIIVGSGDNPYKPEEIYGAPNSFASQRLFGELHLSGFKVTHTKDGIQWEEEQEETFYKKVLEAASDGDLDLMAQATNYSARKQKDLDQEEAQKALDDIKDDPTESDGVPNPEIDVPPPTPPLPNDGGHELNPSSFHLSMPQDNNTSLEIDIVFEHSSNKSDWLSVNLPGSSDPQPWEAKVMVNLSHQFSKNFLSNNAHDYALMGRLVAAMAASQIQWKNTPAFQPGHYPMWLNTYLKRVSSQK